MLSQDTADGALQVWDRRAEAWLPVPAAPANGALLVNGGLFLELASGGRIPATHHRVSGPQRGFSGQRTSMTFFAVPDWDAVLSDERGRQVQVGDLMPFEG